MLYILSQISVFIGVILDLIGKGTKNKKYLLLFLTLSNIFYITSYIFLFKPLPIIANSLFLIRGLVYLVLDNKKAPFKYYLFPMILFISAFCIALGFLWSSPMDLFMLASMLIVSIILAFKNMLMIRIFLIINSALWATYNFTIKGYVNSICDVLQIIVLIYAIIKYSKKPKDESYNVIKNIAFDDKL